MTYKIQEYDRVNHFCHLWSFEDGRFKLLAHNGRGGWRVPGLQPNFAEELGYVRDATAEEAAMILFQCKERR